MDAVRRDWTIWALNCGPLPQSRTYEPPSVCGGRGHTSVVVRRVSPVADNVLWIITDDQMRSTLRTMDRTWRRLVGKGSGSGGGTRDAVVRAGSRVDPHQSLPAQPWVQHQHDPSAVRGSGIGPGHGGDQDASGRLRHRLLRQVHERPWPAAEVRRPWLGPLGHVGRWHDRQPPVNVDGAVRRVGSQREVDHFPPGGCAASSVATKTPGRGSRCSRRHRHTSPTRRAASTPRLRRGALGPAGVQRGRHERQAHLAARPAAAGPATHAAELEGKLEELQDLDDQIGRILDVLRRTGQLRRTWIFFVSDNGYLLGEHRLLRKQQPYEESAGIPFVVRGPGVEPRVEALVSQVDLMPTTFDIAGLDPDAGRDLDGRSMLEPLRSGDWSPGDAACWSRTRISGGRCSERAPTPTSSTTAPGSGSSTTWSGTPTSSPAGATPTFLSGQGRPASSRGRRALPCVGSSSSCEIRR